MVRNNISNRNDETILSLTIWPHRSCTRRTFHLVIVLIAFVLLMPPLVFLELKFAFHILPFSLISVSLLYVFCEKNFKDSQLNETLKIFPERIVLHRSEPTGEIKKWSADPFWTRVCLHNKGPIENYLTLRGNGREVEVGSFLTPMERKDLNNLIVNSIHKLKFRNISS
mgnify:FL=1